MGDPRLIFKIGLPMVSPWEILGNVKILPTDDVSTISKTAEFSAT